MAEHGGEIDRTEERQALKARYLRPRDERPTSAARGRHHFALLTYSLSDMSGTIVG